MRAEDKRVVARIDDMYEEFMGRGYTQTFAKDVIVGLAAGGYFTEGPIATEVVVK